MGTADMDLACDPTMKHVTTILKDSPVFHVQVNGHSDDAGTLENNTKLS
jgi:outer membrane protein OmpA-like peptidoglycan-associated protein